MPRRKATPPPTPWKDRTEVSILEMLEATKTYSSVLAVAIRGTHQKKEIGVATHRDVLLLQEELLLIQTQAQLIKKQIEDYKP